MGILYSCYQECVHFIQKKSSKLFLGLFALLFLGMGNVCWGQVTLAGWDMSGQNTYGISPLSPTIAGGNVTIGNLTKGSGILAGGTAAGRAWGGGTSSTWAVLSSNSISNNAFATFTIKSNSGYNLSLSAISVFDYRISPSGPTSLLLQYQINSGGFFDIQTFTGLSTSSSGGSLGSIDLSTVSALQNLPSSSTVKLRFVPFGVAPGGTWYIFDKTNSTANDLEIKGTVTVPCTAPTTQSSNITFSNVFFNKMDVNWINGNGGGRIVKINTTNTFTAPEDGSTPTANNVYSGSGEQVIFNGTGSGPITVTNISPSTQYYFKVYEYCTAGNTYQTANGTNNPNSQTTTVLKTSAQNGDWNVGATWSPAGVPANNDDVLIQSAHVVYTGTGLTRSASTTVNGGFQINNNGSAVGTAFIYVNGTLIFNSAVDYGVNNDAYWPSSNGPTNVTVLNNGGITMNVPRSVTGLFQTASYVNNGGQLTLNGTGKINNPNGNFYNSSVNWGSTSTLIYNTNSNPFNRSYEWNGSSNPANVQLSNNTILNYPAGGNSARTLAGYLTIDAGSALYMDYGAPTSGVGLLSVGDITINGNLSMGDKPGGDLAVKGDWVRRSAASFNPNNRAVFFNGSTTQTVTVTGGGTENFDYLLIKNTSTIKIGANTDINVNKTNGLTLSSTAPSTIDLNGRTFALPGGGNLNLSSGIRNVNSTTANGTFLINSPTPVVVINGGSLSFNANTNLKLAYGIDCGSGSLVTVNNQLEMAIGGFVQGNSPRYGSGSLLLYSANNAPYNRSLEWTADATNPIGFPGLPHNLKLTNGAILNFINGLPSPAKGIIGTLTIDDSPPYTSELRMGSGSNEALTVLGDINLYGKLTLGGNNGEDLKVGGDLNIFTSVNYLTTNNRAIFFIKNGTQNIYTPSNAALTLPYVILGKPAGTGTTLKINQNLTAAVNTGPVNVINFTNATDILDLNGKTLTIGMAGVSNNITGAGSFKGSNTSNISLLGNGNAGTFNFTTSSTVLNNFAIDRTGGTLAATLGTVLTINSNLFLNNGYLNIGVNKLFFNAGAMAMGGSLNSFIQADGTGQVIKDFTSATSFTYPIGDATGTIEYSPATINFISGTFSSATVGMNVRNIKHPNSGATIYTKRYWNVYTPGTITNYNADLSFTYVPADVIGSPEANINTAGWDGAYWYLGNPANTTTHTLSVTGENALKNSYTGGDVFNPLGSLITDYYRSKQNGDWNVVSSWESSSNGTSGWHDATVVPTSASNTITVLVPHTIIVNSTISLDQTVINGILQIQGAGKLNLDSGLFDDLTINNGGVYLVLGNNNYGNQINYVTGADIHILSGGKIAIGNGLSVTGTDLDRYATDITNNNSASNIWDDGSIFEWNNPGTFGASGLTYFPNVAAGTKPIFRVTKNGGTPGGGLTNPTTINGIFEVNDNVTFASGGDKSFRDGIIGTATLTLPSTIGTVTISGTDPILGGSNLLVNTSKQINLTKGLLVPPGANVKVISNGSGFAKGTNGIFQVDGTLDLSNATISNTSGSVIVNGTLKTSNIKGLYGSGATISNTSLSPILNAGSTIEYNASVAQSITGTTTLGNKYYNITFSGGGTKTPVSLLDVYPNGTVKITGVNTFVDASLNNIGSVLGNNIQFIMDGGRLKLGTVVSPALPLMNGNYDLTGGVIEFSGTSQTIRNKTYQNIEVTGSGVGNSNGNISLQPSGTFIVKNNGVFTINDNSIQGVSNGTASVIVESSAIFKSGNDKGFNGFEAKLSDNSSIHSNITNITLQPGSTVEYSRNSAPPSSSDQPITVANGLVYQNLTLSGTGDKIAPSDTAILTINGNFTKTTASNFVHNGGTVVFNGSSPQTYLSVNPIVMLYNMTNSSNNLIINDTLAVLKKLTLSDLSKITLNNDMVMKSNDTTTANIAKIVTASITYGSGRFIVERFIPRHSKAWQFLAVPTKGSTIKEAWQEGNAPKANGKPGYGTIIFSNLSNPTSRGFDSASYSPSMKTYNSQTDDFTGVSNTTSLIDNQSGYFLFVRGDRSITGLTQPTTATILRTRGKIYAPGVERPGIVNAPPGKYTSVANPYASSINYSGLALTNVAAYYYIYDPQLTTGQTAAYGYGGYRTISGTASVPSSGNYIDGKIPPIQSGQAFFVENITSNPGTVDFPETAKTDSSRSIFRQAGRDGDFTHPDAQLRGNLYVNFNNEYILIDGELTQFQPSYDPGLDGMDARKLMNTGENMGITSHKTSLAIERRPMPSVTDTLFYQLTNMKHKPYRFEFIASKMDISGLEGYVYDRFLKTETALNMSDTTYIDFNVTSHAHSAAANRFMIYFKPAAGPLPVTFTNVNAHLQNKDIVVEWKTENEKEMNGYMLQASLDGDNFNPVTFIKATNNGVGNYIYTDGDAVPGYHYYRVQSVDANGKTALTRIVKVWVGSGKHLITIYPNPIRNNEVNLQFEGQLQGAYKARLLNSAGQVLASKEINFAGGNGNETIQLDQYTAQGVYHLEITQPDGKKVVMKVMK